MRIPPAKRQQRIDPAPEPMPPPVNVEPIAVDKRGVAAMVPLSPRSIERLDAAARMPAGFRLGGRRVWRVADIRRWASLGFPSRKDFEATATAGGGS